MRQGTVWSVVCAAGLAIGGVPGIGGGGSAQANETDQYLLPLDKEIADVGRYLNVLHYQLLETAVKSLNTRIERALALGDPEQREYELRYLHNPRTVAEFVRGQTLQGFIATLALEDAVNRKPMREMHEGMLTSHKRRDWIYHFALAPVDPRNIPLIFQSSTIKVYGVYCGTDKIAHFHDLGNLYFQDYCRGREAGLSHEEAEARVVHAYANGLISEGWIIGFLASGVISNADLASNYAGMKFYRNLTQPEMLKGELRPPLLVRCGNYWRLNHHVRPESDFFAWYVSDHFNEALNNNVYDWMMRGGVERRLRAEAEHILAFYERDGRPRDPAYYENLQEELSTYYGEDYGYIRGSDGGRLSLAVCLSEVGPANGSSLASRNGKADDSGEGVLRVDAPSTRRSPGMEWARVRDIHRRAEEQRRRSVVMPASHGAEAAPRREWDDPTAPRPRRTD